MNDNKISDEVFGVLLYLSRLELAPEERRALSQQVNQLVNHFEVLDKFCDEELDNSIYSSQNESSLRKNEIKESITATDLKKISSEYMDGYFRVPKVLGSGA